MRKQIDENAVVAAPLIRPATLDDVPSLLELYRELDETHRRAHPELFPATVVRDRDARERKLLEPTSGCFVAEVAGQDAPVVAGFVRVVDVQTPDGGVLLPRRYGLVDELVVASPFRRSGIARRLLESAETWSSGRGIAALEVVVWAFNQAAYDLYEKCGYSVFRHTFRKSIRPAASARVTSHGATAVTLRALERADLDQLCRWRNDPDVTRHLARLSMTSEELTSWFASLRGDAGERAFAIIAAGEFVGYATITGADLTNEKCEVGIIIGDRAAWHQGIGSEVARRVAAVAFTELGMHRVLAVASARNLASIRCFQKAGFREEGRLRHGNRRDSEYIDLVLLSLLEPEWRR